MKILYEEYERVGFIAETLNDLQALFSVIREGDMIKSKTIRKIKVNETEAERKLVTVKIRAEKIELVSDVPKLRVLGKIVECDDPQVQLQSHHSIDLELHRQFEIEKEHWNKIDILSIKRAIEQSRKVLFTVILIDDEKAICAEVSPRGYSIKAEFSSNASKRSDDYEKAKASYIQRIINYLKNCKINPPLIVAGPGFTKEKLLDSVKNELKLHCILETVGYANETGLAELMSSEKVMSLVKDYWFSEQEKMVNSFIAHLVSGKEDVTYGLENVQKATDYRAVSALIVHEHLLRNKEVRDLVDKNIDMQAQVTVVSSESDAGAKFKSFGIAAFTKFKIE